MVLVQPASHPHASSAASAPRRFRLVDQQGAPHPILDDLYESLEAAWADAQLWWEQHSGASAGPMAIGVEVSTTSGDWRTLRHSG